MDVFLGGSGKGKRSSRVRVAEKFLQDERDPNSPVLCSILYVEQWRFHCSKQWRGYDLRSVTDSTEQWV